MKESDHRLCYNISVDHDNVQTFSLFFLIKIRKSVCSMPKLFLSFLKARTPSCTKHLYTTLKELKLVQQNVFLNLMENIDSWSGLEHTIRKRDFIVLSNMLRGFQHLHLVKNCTKRKINVYTDSKYGDLSPIYSNFINQKIYQYNHF